ncbi:MAG: Sir2 family NAD-dependent protein deacetylase [Candidatus Coproplasma sp.]
MYKDVHQDRSTQTGAKSFIQEISDGDCYAYGNFGGAGVSTESGIPDFRSADGLYNQKYAYPPEEIISHDFFYANTKEFYRFYRDKMIFQDAKPNAAHLFLARAESVGKLDCVIKPDVVLYGESLDDSVVSGALNAISRADTLIIGGTSLIVYPAAGLVNYFNGKHLVVINKSATSADSGAQLLINAPIGETFSKLSI